MLDRGQEFGVTCLRASHRMVIERRHLSSSFPIARMPRG